jgi:DNA topoisomerase-1
MSEYKGEQTPIYLTSPLSGCQYVHKVEVPLFLGWKFIYGNDKMIEEQSVGTALCMYIKSCITSLNNTGVTYESIMAKVAIHGRHSHYTEASLISRLEDVGIGRPSTYASLVETIIDRGYVKKMDIEGTILSIVEYGLEGGSICESVVEKRVGQEKGKLVIQPVGVMVCEFLTRHFGALFAYDYTKSMELELDEIALGGHKDICSLCDSQIDELIKPTEKLKCVIKGSDDIVVFGRYGPMIQRCSRELLSVKKDIDMGKLQRGEYSLDELVVKNDESVIGEYCGKPVIVKTGPYGKYIQYDGENIGYRVLDIKEDTEDVFSVFMKYKGTSETPEGGEGGGEEGGGEEDKTKKMIRELTQELSIRNGKFGAYIHYHKAGMKKPKFFKLKGFTESYRFCQKEVLMKWIKETYGV